MLRDIKRKFYSNFHLFLGILIGLYVSTLLSTPQCYHTDTIKEKNGATVTKVALHLDVSTPGQNISRRLVTAKKVKPIRPR